MATNGDLRLINFLELRSPSENCHLINYYFWLSDKEKSRDHTTLYTEVKMKKKTLNSKMTRNPWEGETDFLWFSLHLLNNANKTSENVTLKSKCSKYIIIMTKKKQKEA